uniref:Serologically defined colon cancer antigen 8 homolog n=1 Tax=Cacopsylla melanoneura TaxID=428564 RepID=A0A8D8SWW3_9HEMI
MLTYSSTESRNKGQNVASPKKQLRFQANMYKSKKFKPRKSNVLLSKMDAFKKKSFDYPDSIHKEAVSKLKHLLSESYNAYPTVSVPPVATATHSHSHTHTHCHSPSPGSLFRGEDAGYGTGLPRFAGVYRPQSSLALKRPEMSVQPPPELVSFIQKQEDYISQMEKESQYCREQLSGLMSKVKEIVTENENLHEKQKSNLVSNMFASIEYGGEEEESEEEEVEVVKHRRSNTPRSRSPRSPAKTLQSSSNSPIVFESRISELEAQLTKAKVELKNAVEEANQLRLKLTEPSDQVAAEMLKKIESLQAEKEDLNETLTKMQGLILQFREKEASALQKVKRSLDIVDQAQFEKGQAEQEMRRMISELERAHEKHRDSLQEQSKLRIEAEKRYSAQAEKLSQELQDQWDTASKLGLEVEKLRRVETEVRRELMQKNNTIEELKRELNNKTCSLQNEALNANSERESLEQELSNAKLSIERLERTQRQEAARTQAELSSYKQRLDRADADLLHSRKENIRLTEQIANLEKELQLARLSSDDREDILQDSKKDKELTSLIMDMDAKHGKRWRDYKII